MKPALLLPDGFDKEGSVGRANDLHLEPRALCRKIKNQTMTKHKLTFTPQSKMGKMLMAKCRTLQEENEEIGHQAAEGKIHELAMKLTMQKSQNAELRNQFEGLFKHMEALTNDVERSNEMVMILQEKLEEKQKAEKEKEKAEKEKEEEEEEKAEEEMEEMEETERTKKGVEAVSDMDENKEEADEDAKEVENRNQISEMLCKF